MQITITYSPMFGYSAKTVTPEGKELVAIAQTAEQAERHVRMYYSRFSKTK